MSGKLESVADMDGTWSPILGFSKGVVLELYLVAELAIFLCFLFVFEGGEFCRLSTEPTFAHW